MSHNLWRKVPKFGTTDKSLLMIARFAPACPWRPSPCVVAAVSYSPGEDDVGGRRAFRRSQSEFELKKSVACQEQA